jgi:hypothetical protein
MDKVILITLIKDLEMEYIPKEGNILYLTRELDLYGYSKKVEQVGYHGVSNTHIIHLERLTIDLKKGKAICKNWLEEIDELLKMNFKVIEKDIFKLERLVKEIDNIINAP